jgi:hypothetical protein
MGELLHEKNQNASKFDNCGKKFLQSNKIYARIGGMRA